MTRVYVSGSFDNLRSPDFRFLEEAAKLGDLCVQLWDDETCQRANPDTVLKFPLAERLYVVQAVRYVQRVVVLGLSAAPGEPADPDSLDMVDGGPAVWAVEEAQDTPQKRAFAAARGLAYHLISPAELAGFPPASASEAALPAHPGKKIIVTGCYDWLHSGHVRFFEEVSALGALIVAVGHDANIRLLKGEGHPLFPQDERLYMVQSIRSVHTALLTTGSGWMDAAPEIERLKPDAYAVNEDGDKPEKRAFCAEHGLEYIVLTRTPKPGLPKRQSTDLRGF